MYHRPAERCILEDIMAAVAFGANYCLICTHTVSKYQLSLQTMSGRGSMVAMVTNASLTRHGFESDQCRITPV
ncbi:hypothetical protein TNCV_1550281 [Trichonephila clavipes]|uniref:Uncharacterized protein n=1 Tax=Trichonephila clavipes TaxID=2585209 RepID=A0A8X6RV53_TRICX|nr:hypothetical protein TNCV_1550281 [Trichonephila clavipes]